MNQVSACACATCPPLASLLPLQQSHIILYPFPNPWCSSYTSYSQLSYMKYQTYSLLRITPPWFSARVRKTAPPYPSTDRWANRNVRGLSPVLWVRSSACGGVWLCSWPTYFIASPSVLSNPESRRAWNCCQGRNGSDSERFLGWKVCESV